MIKVLCITDFYFSQRFNGGEHKIQFEKQKTFDAEFFKIFGGQMNRKEWKSILKKLEKDTQELILIRYSETIDDKTEKVWHFEFVIPLSKHKNIENL